MTIYQRAFKNTRAFLKISLRRLSSFLEVDPAYISRIENGKQTPSLALIKKLENVTGLSFWALEKGDIDSENQYKYSKFSKINSNYMILDFKELSAADRTDVREKFNVKIKELDKKLNDAKDKLNARVEKSTLSEGELEKLEAVLQGAQANLNFLTTNNANADMVASQQVIVEEAEKDLRDTRRKSGILTDQELVDEQVEIKEIEASIKIRQDMIAEIDAIP